MPPLRYRDSHPVPLGLELKLLLFGARRIEGLAKWLHPMRASHYLLSLTFSPCCADWLSLLPNPSATGAPRCPTIILTAERTYFSLVTALIERTRVNRDEALEKMFEAFYSSASQNLSEPPPPSETD